MAPTSPTSGRRRRPCEAAIAALAVVLLALLMGSASASTYGGPSPAATSPNKFYTEQGFVRAEGKRFMVKDKPFYFQGTNMYWLALGAHSSATLTEANIDGILATHAANGLRVIRFWGFGEGWRELKVDSKVGWTLHDWAFRRLDFTVSKAKHYGIRLIFPFVNYEEDYTGMQFWVDAILGKGKDKEMFFSEKQIWWRFQEYIANLVNHWNPLTGLAYRDDPTILAWEIANEPHTRNWYERWRDWPTPMGDMGLLVGRGQLVGRLVNQFLCKAATYIKSLDGNHLVTTGEEGYRAFGPWHGKHDWINNGMKGVDFELNTRCPDVDFMTIHVYPDNWDIPFWDFWFAVEHVIKDRARVAHAANKPIVLEEYGCCKQADYRGKRGELFRAFHDAADGAGFAGTIVWQVSAWSGLKRDGNYDFTYDEDGGREIADHAAKMNNKWW